ncbi:MAG TPA: sigma-70 family RNA polymerase sigma factor [Pirellulaceae bacterium]|nr:sigma-70 family RNA polymerase sigma factor [Pirellulaceae bacterium]
MSDAVQTASAETSSSLLHRAQSRDADAWRRLAELYGPVVYRWVRQAGFQEHDAADIVQDVFQSVLTSLDRFGHQRPTDRFRDWLWTITRRRAIDFIRQRAAQPAGAGGTEAQARIQELPEQLPEANGEEAASAEAELVRRALELVRPEFAEHTWQACVQTAIDGRRPADVAADLEMTVGAVYVARSRVLKRLRQELEGLV